MKVLVIGGGGREHAMAWKLSQSPKVTKVYVAPGNGGTALNPKLENVAISDVRELRVWAQAEKISLTVVGPEAPLAAGLGLSIVWATWILTGTLSSLEDLLVQATIPAMAPMRATPPHTEAMMMMFVDDTSGRWSLS